MKRYILPKTGAISDLTPDECATPQPGRGQVLVRMKAASLNYRDLMIVQGRYARGGVAANRVPLSDGAGEVVEIGDEVSEWQVGDRVAGLFMQDWLGGEVDARYGASAMGGAIDGALTEYRVFDAHGLVRLPEHFSFEQGATLPCAAVTAWNALYAGQHPLKSGDSVLLLGTGGVSIFALQLARAAGARIIQTSSSDDKLERARELGADDTINYRQHPEWQEEVQRLTGGRGVDHVVEVGGAGTLPRSLASSRVGGAVNLIGVLTGGEIDPSLIMRRSVILRGIYVGSREMFEAMNRTLELHRIEPVIDRTFAFDEARAAFEHLESQRHLGKVVIRID
ncbi:NADPH:quinone reductase-like Zn-dependent oxidoreductase [Kushneria sinocarnis]|uniref:NADPH:quinone reductase-like Zn-dependent oxidoreductase n=1 Tax=Kushneria sinocarnis TaxID=595502 RepID=A0A420WXS0_9GAMM|nr:NAD(P)-dependent alcohol dehydrogenase [Kushneria sinocarnis]RKR04472.1 NADPH:quinone reductase-like Zn-dependent oxidoreductase [Kushneria sinocarnis]